MHQRVHDNNLFQCYFCPWSGYHEAAFTKHCNHHFNIKPYKCSFCEIAFYDASGKSSHEIIFHEKISDRFKCQFCDYKTHHGNNLRKHILRNHPLKVIY